MFSFGYLLMSTVQAGESWQVLLNTCTKLMISPSFRGLAYNAIVSHGKVLKNAQLENTDGKKKLKVSCFLDVKGKKI